MGSAFSHGRGCLVAPSAMAPRATRWQIWLMNPEQYFILGEGCLTTVWTPRSGPSVPSIPQHWGQTPLLEHGHPSDTRTRCTALGTRTSACAWPHLPVLVPISSLCLFVSPACHRSHLSPHHPVSLSLTLPAALPPPHPFPGPSHSSPAY